MPGERGRDRTQAAPDEAVMARMDCWGTSSWLEWLVPRALPACGDSRSLWWAEHSGFPGMRLAGCTLNVEGRRRALGENSEEGG